jgi:hypothetical protein
MTHAINPLRSPRRRHARLGLAIPGLLALLLLVFASSAFAGLPNHPRHEALDVAGLNHACGVAVDSEGDLYVASAGGGKIKVFAPGNHTTPIAEIPDAHEPCGLAVNSKGELFVSEKALGNVVRYKPNAYPLSATPSYGAAELIDGSGQAKGISVDPHIDRLYVAEGNRIADYGPNGELGINEVQHIQCFQASGGTYRLLFQGQQTEPIPCESAASTVQHALEELSTIGSGNVSVETDGKQHLVTFLGALGHSNVESLGSDPSGLTPEPGAANAEILVEERVRGFGGYIGEGELEDATGIAAYSYPSVEPFAAHLFVADAAGAGPDVVKLFTGRFHFEGGTLERFGPVSVRRVITGVDQDRDPETPEQQFGFGPAGAYLAVDPGNQGSEEKCASIAEQACTAGHVVVYDAAHQALDELDASGEFLDQTVDPGLADAEPTAMALDRSGGPDDGTIYVSAGAGAGAKVLAFGPLAQPSRPPLGTPLSHVLPNAQAVATDRFGDVYVAAGSSIHVFRPDGSELLREEGGKMVPLIADTHTPLQDLAVDSTGKLYVLESESQVTYYTPGAFPPTGGTAYAGHEPPVASSSDFGGEKPLAIALNPGPSAGKDHLFITDGTHTYEYDSAAHGSALLDAEFAEGPTSKSLCRGIKRAVAVDGRTGDVYFGENSPRQICIVDPTGEDVLARINGAGSGKGSVPAGPVIAVDQANGHVVDFSSSFGVAQEFDAAGGFVAEYGQFTPLVRQERIAVDNACALHEPPLTEQTTPTCQEFDPSAGNVYVAFDDTAPHSFDLTAFGPLAYGEPPDAATGAASDLGAGKATLNGNVNPDGFEPTRCEFEYLLASAYEQNLAEAKPAFQGAQPAACGPGPLGIGHGNSPVAVSAEVALAQPQQAYRFRLVAENKYGESSGDAHLFGPPHAKAFAALPVAFTEANLRGRVDPAGLPTNYRFEYVTQEAFEAEGFAHPQIAKQGILEGEAPLLLQAPLSGLAEGTGYRFRLLAESEDGSSESGEMAFTTLERRAAESCPNAEYRTGASASLPDCRAYELVTPPQTNGLSPLAEGPGTSGPGAAFSDWLTSPGGEGAGGALTYFTEGTLPGFDGNGRVDGYRADRGPGDHPASGWSSEFVGLSYAQAGGSHPDPLGGSADQRYAFWRVGSLSDIYLHTPAGFELLGQGSLASDPQAESRFLSADGQHAIFTSAAHLEEGAAPSGTRAVYDRQPGSRGATVISIRPDGQPFGAGEGATFLASTEGGTAVAFQVGGAIYLRREGRTYEVAAAPATFAGLSEDGKRVFDAAAGSGSAPASLFLCDTAAGSCAGPEAAQGATELAPDGLFINVSADGSHAFFVSEEVLDEAEEGAEGDENLYEWVGSTIRFVAALSPADFENRAFGDFVDLGRWTQAIGPGGFRGTSPTRSTSDGGVLVFQSHARLTAYDNEGVGEVYRYQRSAADGERLLCLSCAPAGAPPGGEARLENFGKGGALDPSTIVANLTDSGTEAFFESPDRLLPEDANATTDVYEWQARGIGSCQRPSGCLALISSGQGDGESLLYSITRDGHDVFFRTLERLVAVDAIGTSSLYDARVDGGIPEAADNAPCQGDACQGQGSGAPPLPGTATSGAGGGNAGGSHRPRCPKGKHRRHHHCVKGHHHHRRHHHHHTGRKGSR